MDWEIEKACAFFCAGLNYFALEGGLFRPGNMKKERSERCLIGGTLKPFGDSDFFEIVRAVFIHFAVAEGKGGGGFADGKCLL